MVSVEAQSFGCPVIGYNSGGIAETVINGKTGILFNNLDPESCVEAIKKFQKSNIKSADCIANAQKFSQRVFIEKISKLVTRNC